MDINGDPARLVELGSTQLWCCLVSNWRSLPQGTTGSDRYVPEPSFLGRHNPKANGPIASGPPSFTGY